jgi:response regulator receiver domain-containing protein
MSLKAGIEDNNNTTLTRKIEVHTSNNPVVALSEFKPNFYDLLLVDINMPHMNGFELCEKIKQGYNDSYVASCTHGKFGCGDGPTTCTQGEKCVLPSSLPQPQPCKGNGICPSPPPPGPTPCKKGEVLINGKCVSLGSCHLIDNGTKFECSEEGGHTTIIERNTIQQVPIITSTNDINLFIVTTCTADQNNGVLNGNLAALCDSTITMMHNDGLDAQLPQVDLYLKARGLLQ